MDGWIERTWPISISVSCSLWLGEVWERLKVGDWRDVGVYVGTLSLTFISISISISISESFAPKLDGFGIWDLGFSDFGIRKLGFIIQTSNPAYITVNIK